MTDYITSAALKSTLNFQNETYADADIAAAITAASQGLDSACNRRFWKDAEDVTRYYTPFSRHLIVIDDLANFTSLSIDMNGDNVFELALTENTHFVFEPLNAVADGWPREVIRILHRTGRRLPDPEWYPRSVELVGKFGWPAVPPNIVEATTILASKLLRRAREAPFGIVALGGLDAAAVVHIARTDPDINFLISGFIRKPTPA